MAGNTRNVIILGLAFMFVFTSYLTLENILKTMLHSMDTEHPGFTGEAYTSLAVLYIFFSMCTWLSPSILSLTGPRAAMLLGSVSYAVYIGIFYWPQKWLLYGVSAVLGIGSSITWTAQGNFLTRCSNKDTISKNSGIFWTIYESSMLFGNIFVYFVFEGKTLIDDATRYVVVTVLLAVAVIGTGILFFLRPVAAAEDGHKETGLKKASLAFHASRKLFCTRDMLLLSVTTAYSGILMSFMCAIYPASIGFTLQIAANPKRLVGLVGMCLGLGEITAGACFGLLGSRMTRYGGRTPFVLCGLLVHTVAYTLIILNVPDNALSGNTEDVAYFSPPLVSVALLCAFLLGFGDGCYATPMISLLGDVYASVSGSAFALYRFVQTLSSAVAFFYSPSVGMQLYVAILFVFMLMGALSFCFVERVSRKRMLQKERDLANVPEMEKLQS